MKKTIIIILIFVSHISSINAQNQIETPDDLLNNLINNKDVVGASAAYTIDGKLIWESAVGFSDKEEKKSYTLNTEFRTASIAKSMTAVAIMQLVEQGLIDLDEPIDIYIPEFVQKGKTKITTRHLLTHTSGIDAYKNLKEVRNKTNYKSLLAAYDVFKDRKLLFEPGTKYTYTSYGYLVLGILIEKVSGITYEAYMQKNIWDKSEMEHTGIEKSETNRPNTATLYHRNKKGKLSKAIVNNLSNRIPAGGFYSTTGDLIKFGNALLNNSLIKQETLELMCQHHSLEKVNNSYGFGFFLYGQSPNVGSIYGHNGAQSGTSTQLFIVPSLKTVIVVASNTSGAGREVSTIAGKLIGIAKDQN